MYPFHRDQIYCYVHASPGVERDSVIVIVDRGLSCHTSPHSYVRLCSENTIAGGAHCPHATLHGGWPSGGDGGGRTGRGTEIGPGSLTLTTNLQKCLQQYGHISRQSILAIKDERTTVKKWNEMGTNQTTLLCFRIWKRILIWIRHYRSSVRYYSR